MDSTGAPAAGIAVQLLPAAYNPVAHDTLATQWRTVSDSRGEYRLDKVTAGTYALEAGSASAGVKTLVKGIEISGKKIEVAVDTGSLHKTGTVIVRLAGMIPRGGDYVYLPGTNSFAFISALDSTAGKTVLSDVPSGTFTDLIYVAAADSQNTDLLGDTLTLQPGDTLESEYAAWKFSRRLVLNTTASGADIQGNVHDFPILVRLNDATFDFTQAQIGGRDVRFTKSDGMPLDCEIERWDAAGRLAEIWVRIDTVFGNDSMQSITMYWGNTSTAGSSNSMMVFDTTVGFLCVWHLGERIGPIFDATINGFAGTVIGNQKQVTGHIGFGQYFSDSGDYTEIMNVPDPDTSGVTVCAWIKLSAIKKRQTIISKSRGGLPSSSYGWLVTLDENGALQAFASSDTGVWGNSHTFVLTSKTVITDTTTWHHVAAIINRTGNKNCHLFIDAADVTVATAAEITTVGSITSTFPVKIGSEGGGGYPWNGSLDECSVSYKVRSTDWVRLCYMNQRLDDKLIVFK
ncbi:MAG: DUF2341 domain-containing protein [Chitinispirillaceae bacterium]|nr:DUF2341 domain-containing protein [Chitinispirillaceae bacterium]